MVQLRVAAVSLVVLLSGCAAGRMTSHARQPAPQSDSVLATLGRATIRESDFQRFLRNSYQPQQVSEARQNPAARQEALEAYLDLQVMAAKARKVGINKLTTFQKARELMEMKILAGLLNERERQRAAQGTNVTGNSGEEAGAARQASFESLWAEMGLKQTVLASTNVSLMDPSAIPADAILATLGGVPLREADFQWFLKDACRREQRMRIFSRPGARSQLLAAFLNLRVMEAKARKEGLDKSRGYLEVSALMEMRLLAEFLQERDRTAPWMLPGATEEARMTALKAYTNRLRTEMGLKERPAPPAGTKSNTPDFKYKQPRLEVVRPTRQRSVSSQSTKNSVGCSGCPSHSKITLAGICGFRSLFSDAPLVWSGRGVSCPAARPSPIGRPTRA